ncbi:DNA ligase [Uliginosibacterium sp. 31-16]|uniref:DNA ligase n=1 Tax=Uliginosibacterium sp. 31-16 TaxID=3068315 RepID=UPI00273D72D0|nr:DNA ligase [Uliginosibacterium sp. 31-16]MDP5240640.1 DNA ligase [Uliginosibacterium sp. 31-16]
MRILLALLLIGLCASVRAEAPILLAEVYRSGINPADYLVSEKLDGVRAIWDGKALRFRSGNPVQAPAWFIAGLPAAPLDGELWAGRGSFERLSGIVRKDVPVDAEWRDVRYMIFELPEAPGDFSARATRIRELVSEAQQPWLQAIEQFHVKDATELKQRMTAVVKAGGEGLMLHRADAPYLTGRSNALLKLKSWEDAEARVVGHVPGKGRHDGRLGALIVERPDGRRFRVGSGFTDAQREAPPAIGETITYRYQSLTAGGLPRFPGYVRVRKSF